MFHRRVVLNKHNRICSVCSPTCTKAGMSLSSGLRALAQAGFCLEQCVYELEGYFSARTVTPDIPDTYTFVEKRLTETYVAGIPVRVADTVFVAPLITVTLPFN